MTRLWRRRKDDLGGRASTSSADPVSAGEASRHAAFLEHVQEGMSRFAG